MEKRLNITAVCGWAIPEKWFAEIVGNAFPTADVRVIYPQRPKDRDEAKSLLKNLPCDLYIGFSLGSLWLLYHKDLILKPAPIALLAPIIDFTDKEKGSKIPSGKLNYLTKQITNGPDHIPYVIEFFKICEMNIPIQFLKTMPTRETLLRGLDFLRTVTANKNTLEKCIGIVGNSDAILDGEGLKKIMPQLEIIPGVGHEPGKLLETLSKNRIFTNS